VRFEGYERRLMCCASLLIQLRFRRTTNLDRQRQDRNVYCASQLRVEQIEAELADEAEGAARKWRLRQRAGLVRGLLSRRRNTLLGTQIRFTR
jgi:hypothetical protein